MGGVIADPALRLIDRIESGDPLSIEERRAVADILRVALAPAPRPGQRRASTVIGMEKHATELRAMAARFYPELSTSAAAAAIHHRLALYRGGPDWRRDRVADAVDYANTIRGGCWRALRAYDRLLSVRSIREKLAES